MRDAFVLVLRLQSWLSPLVFAYYGYVSTGAVKRSEGLVGGLIGLFVGCLFLVMWAGLADLAQTIWASDKAAAADKTAADLAALRGSVAELSKTIERMKGQGAQLTELKASVDDLHEGLSDVMEETLKRISGITAAVGAPKTPEDGNR